MRRRPSLLKSTLMLTLVGLIAQGSGFLYRIFLARMVGAETIGLFELIMPFFSVMQAFCLSGLSVSISVLSSEYHAKENEVALRQLVRTSLRGLLMLWLPLGALVVWKSDWIAGVLLGDSRTRLGLVLLIPALGLTGIENLQKQHLYGIGEMQLPAAVEIVEKLLRCFGGIALLAVFLTEDPQIAAGLMVMGILLSEIFSAVALSIGRWRLQRSTALRGHSEAADVLRRKMLHIALPVSVTALCGNLMGAATNVMIPKLLMLRGLTAGDAISEFGVLMGMTMPLLMIPTAFINALCIALQPRLTELRTLGQMQAFRATAEKAMLAVSFLVLPLLALIATLGPELSAMLFHDARAGAHMLPLAVGVAAGCYHGVLGCMLNALEMQKQAAAVSLSCNALELLGTVALTSRFGLAGYAVCSTLISLLAVALCLMLVWQKSGFAVNCYRCFSAPALSALLAGLLINLGYRFSRDCGVVQWQAVAGCTLVGTVCYLGAMLAQGIRPIGTLRS